MKFATQSYVILVLVTILPTGFSLKCFQCNSAEHPECADIQANDTTSKFLQECKDDYENKEPFCRKVVTKVLDSEDKRTLRSCGWILDKNIARKDICRKRDSDFILKKSCYCFSEMCNDSMNLGRTYWMLPVCLVWYLLNYISFI